MIDFWDWAVCKQGKLIKNQFQSAGLWFYKAGVWRCAGSRVCASVNLTGRNLMTARVFVIVLFINKPSE